MLFFNRYRLELIVFVSGAAVMILELLGSRILAPYLGTSTFVWTSLIGIVLGSLSLGYWWGGRIADRKPEYGVFSLVIFLSGVSVGLVAFVDTFVIIGIQNWLEDLRWAAVASSLALFGLPSVLFGMVSPYAVRLKITEVAKSGATVGSLYAVATVGSIIGTFLAGFVLISHFSNTRILFFLSALMVATSLFAYTGRWVKVKVACILFFILGALGAPRLGAVVAPEGFVDVNTDYARVWIFDDTHGQTGRPIRIMQIANESSSAMFLDGDDLVLEYTRFYRLAEHFRPGFKKALMIGGAAYSFPKYFLKAYPGAEIDVVEIDPRQTALARRYFGLKDDPGLRIYHEDGRIFLNRTAGKYDVIYLDAFKSLYAIPHQLATQEAIQKVYGALNDDGVFLTNLISSIEGGRGALLQALYATVKSVFPQVFVFGVTEPDDSTAVQNIMLVALKSEKSPPLYSTEREINQMLQHIWVGEIESDLPLLKDDFAPVEAYIAELVRDPLSRYNPIERRIKSLVGRPEE